MDVSFVPTLEHLTSVKIVTSLLNGYDLCWNVEFEYYRIKHEVTKKISKLITCDLLQRMLESSLVSLWCEINHWVEFCDKNWPIVKLDSTRIMHRIPQHWKPDGTIDREKFMNILVKDRDKSPINRFIFVCIFCLYEDVLDLWGTLLRIEKGFLWNRCLLDSDSDISYFIIKHWIEWLQGSTDKDWKSFVARALETPVWKSNIYMLKRVLQTLSPTEKNKHLVEALTGGEVSNDMMRFGLSIMPRDEREVVFRQSPLQVFRCILEWPLRSVFFDFANDLWPYITEDTFCRILKVMLSMIEKEEKDYVELLVIMKSFWAQSPLHYKKATEIDSSISRSLDFLLKDDCAQSLKDVVSY